MSELAKTISRNYAATRKYDHISPARSQSLQEWWQGWLEARFGSIGYWKMSKEWKAVHFASCAGEVLTAIDTELHFAHREEEPTELW